ncbi:glycine zipper domain-containing protein [Aquibium sp. LZ166]|uniref:Glycine zipper domain-containing protein n=1 Tax=Aquibium pacificus TaxID=3153579 RepID=A0ABV3SJV0_9HYPH
MTWRSTRSLYNRGGFMALQFKFGSRLAVAAVLFASLGLAGCETTGQGAAVGGVIGGTAGCGIGAAVASNSKTGCLVGGLVGALAGAMIGDAIEREQQRRVVYNAARSGGSASSGTFRNSKGQKVRFNAKTTKTTKKSSDPGLSCRSLEVTKYVEGSKVGTSSANQCQVRVAGEPTWATPEA